jgi:hypothetical protein
MEDGYTQLGTVLTDQRPEDSEGDGVIVVGRFKGEPYDGVQLGYEAGRRNLYLTPEGRCGRHSCSRRPSKRYRHPVGIMGSRWMPTEISLFGLTWAGRIPPGSQRGALSIALIHGGGVSVGISRPQGCPTAQDHPRRHANTLCIPDVPVEEVYA